MINRWSRQFRSCILAVLILGLANCSGVSSLLDSREPVTLKFVYLKNSADYPALADSFHRLHRSINIQLVPIEESGEGLQRFKDEAMKADALRIPAFLAPEYINPDLLSLDAMLATSRDFPYEDLFPGSLDSLKLDGHQVGLPAGINPYVIFYMPEKFQAAGVQAPVPNWRLEDFLAKASEINNQSKKLAHTDQFTYGFCTHPMLPDPVIFAYLFGGSLVDNAQVVTQPTLNTQANIDAVKWYISLKSDFGLMPANTRNMRNISLWIGSSNCGFWMDLLDRSIFGDRIKVPVAMLPLPGYKSSFELATLDINAIMARTEHAEEAFQWISFLMEQQEAAGRLIPPLKSQIASTEYASRVSADVLAVARSLPEQTVWLGVEMYKNNRFGTALTLFNQAAAQALEGSTDVESALNEAQARAEQEFYK